MNKKELSQRRRILNRWPIRRQILRNLMLAVLLPTLIVLGLNLFSFYSLSLQRAEESLQSLAQFAASRVGDNLQSAVDEVYLNSQDLQLANRVIFHTRMMFNSPEDDSLSMRVRTANVLGENLERHPTFDFIRLLTLDGQLIAQAGRTDRYPAVTQRDQSDNPAFQQIAADGLPFDRAQLLETYADPTSGALLLEVVTAVLGEGNLYGYLIVTLQPEALLNNALETARLESPAAIAAGPDLFLVDANGWLLTPTRDFAAFTQQLNTLPPAENTARYARTWGSANPVSTIGRDVMLNSGWHVIAEVPHEAVVRPIQEQMVRNSLPILALATLITLVVGFLQNRQIANPIVRLARYARRIADGDLPLEVPVDDRQDELGQLNRAIAELAAISLENDRLLSQTETRARQLQTSAEVSRAAASILDVSELLPRVVDLIRDAFGYDHVQVFLMDEGHKNALLRASTGPVGQKMLSLKWSLPVGSESVIGQVTANAQPVIALDTADARFVHRPNPHLPDTRSEMALPLVSRGRVIGALDVQSKQPNAFFDEDVRVLTTLADQIAIALDNASLFQQTQNYTLALTEQVHNLQELLEASQALSAMLDPQDILNAACEDMARLLAADHVGIVLAQEQDPRRGNMIADYPDLGIRGAEVEVEGAWWHDHYSKTSQPVVVQNVTTSDLITEETRRALLANNIQQLVLVPFLVSAGQVRGSIGIDMYTSGRVFTLEDLTLLQLFATQVASAYQNALSFAWTQRQAEEMAFLFQVTTAAAEVTELESCMQTVLQELQHALPNDVLAAYMTNPDTASFECVASLSESSAVTPAERIPMSSWISRQALSGRRPFLLPDIHQQENAYGLPATPLRSLIVAPLFSGSSVVGLVVALKHEPNAYNESNLRLLQALSGSISAVVENIRLLDEVRAINSRLREVDKIKSQFLANMSHELRTPLNSIIGFSRVILKGIDGPLTDMQTQDLETIHSSGQHLLNLINDILDQAKIEADKLSINMNWFAIDSVIEVARSMSIGLLKDRPVRLNVETEPNLPKLWGDEIRTRQVLLNLLSNAAKFTFEGAITISAFQIEREDGPYVQISVADTGIGIPEDSLDKIFVAFEQVDGSLTRASGGTGLGLPISRSLIAMMGGELWVESTVNVGSTFNFYIPAFAKQVETDDSDDEQPEAQIDEAAPALEQQMLPRRTMVMVIDSEVGLHQHYRRHLNAVGYTVEATAASHQAVELARQFQPDMVVFDVRTPEGDGWETLEHLRAYPETAQIPVIVCSAEIDEARLHQMGIAAWLPKPLQAGRLQAAVREVEAQHVHDRVLIVDDRPETVRLILETLREQERYYIQTATSGQQALDLIARKRPDLVLLDLNMPDLDGLTVLEQLRSNPRTHHIPVLIITAEDEMAAELQGRMGAVDVFSKNEADPAQLLSGVQTLLKESNGQPAGGTHA